MDPQSSRRAPSAFFASVRSLDNAAAEYLPPVEPLGRGFGQRELTRTLQWLQWREAPNVRDHRPSKRLDLTSLASSAAWYVVGVSE
jgi:hypothetical protein